MNIEFKSQEELYNRVKPALKSKKIELKKYGYNVLEKDIWNFLSSTIFKTSVNLTLADIVSNIMHLDIEELMIYINNSKNMSNH